MGEVVQCLPSKHESLISNPSTTTKLFKNKINPENTDILNRTFF
jgi:hypothetical protein